MTYVVLAAGSAARMGFDKVFTPLAGATPIERIARVLEGRRAIAVVPSARRAQAGRLVPKLEIVENGEPQRGMAHSLRLGLGSLSDGEDFGVLLGDKPFVTIETLETLERALDGNDVAYPVAADGTPGHPVLFAARLRDRALRLPDGDAISLLRDDATLRVARVPIADRGAFSDLDTREEWEAARDA